MLGVKSIARNLGAEVDRLKGLAWTGARFAALVKERGAAGVRDLPRTLTVLFKSRVVLTESQRKQTVRAAIFWLLLTMLVGVDAGYFFAERLWLVGIATLLMALVTGLLGFWLWSLSDRPR